MAVAATGNRLLTSPNGLTWTAHPSGTYLPLRGVRYLNGQFIAVGDYGVIRSSLDGTTWKPMTIDIYMDFAGVAYGNGRYVAVGNYLSNPDNSSSKLNLAVTSTDGMNFILGETNKSYASASDFRDVAFENGLFVALGANANVQTSVDGKDWSSRFSHDFRTLYGITYGGGRFVAVGNAGFFIESTDGVTWAEHATGSAATYRGITYVNGQFVAVGDNGTIGISPNGINWTAINAGGNQLNSVAYGNGMYVAVGNGGATLRSTNGTTWTNVVAFTGSDINQITFANGLFVTVGEDGEIFTSPNGTAWTPRVSNSHSKTLFGLTHGNGLFVAVGVESTFVTSPDGGDVPPVNQAPTVANVIPNQVATINQNFSYTIPANTFTDPNGDVLTLSAAGLPNGVSLNGTTLSGTPTAGGASVVTVTATDGGNLSVSTQFTLTVNPASSNPGAFAITGVTLVSCQAVSATQRQLVFTPQYTGLSGQPVTFEVVNETLPTTKPGPYTLGIYIDNPTILLKASQSGTSGVATFSYQWSLACATQNARVGVRPLAESAMDVRVMGNPVENGAVQVEVQGVDGQSVQMNLTNLRGDAIGSHQVGQASGVEQHTFEVSQQPAGLYLLRVSTPTQMKTVKVLKR